jgi:ADP-heptose:LPS heptosyltransferase
MLVKRMLPKQKVTRQNHVSLREFHEKRNKILIVRNARGLGDILMHRMIFEDFKRVMPDMHLTFACPRKYHEVAKHHPFVDDVIDSTNVKLSDYLVSYDTSACCVRWENAHFPNADKHRADLWAEHCGVILTKHNMHVPFIDSETLDFGLFRVKQAKAMAPKLYNQNSPNVLFTPIAFDVQRTLTDEQIEGTVKYLKDKGYFVYSTHDARVEMLEDLGVPVLYGYNLRQWCSFIHAADYVVTVDTAVFHYAGGIRKPMTGIFTHVDGKYRGRYFDFVLVQKHRDNGDWPCGPCYNFAMCNHPKCENRLDYEEPRPCLTELTVGEITEGLEKMFAKWPK